MKYKLFWFYLKDRCNNAGIWNVNFKLASLQIGRRVIKEDALKYLGKKIHEYENGSKWWIPSFVSFQYGELKENVNAHKSVIGILKRERLNQQLINSSLSDMDKDKDKDKAKDKDMVEERFESFWEVYPKKSNKVDCESAFKKLNPNDVLMTLILADITLRKDSRKWNDDNGQYIPNPSTYIRKKRWEDEQENKGRHVSNAGDEYANL